MRSLLAVTPAAVALLLSVAVAQQPCDGTFYGRRACEDSFPASRWAPATFVGTQGSSATATFGASCGNAAPGVSVTCSPTPPSAGYAYAGVELLCQTAVWNPATDCATCPMTTVSMSVDVAAISSSGTGQAVFPLLKQGNLVYLSLPPVTTGPASTWSNVPFPHRTAASFERLIGPDLTTDPLQHPNFSCAGGLITFGFLVANSGSAPFSRTHCYDNWEVIVECPATFAVLPGCGCLGCSGVPLIGAVGTPPRPVIGNPTFGLALGSACPNSPAVLVIGFSDTTCGFGALPIPMATVLPAFGFGVGCRLCVCPDYAAFFTTDAVGAAQTVIGVPPDRPDLIGLPLFAQWHVLSPVASSSDKASMVIGTN